jgi:hypothetical protein
MLVFVCAGVYIIPVSAASNSLFLSAGYAAQPASTETAKRAGGRQVTPINMLPARP